jgi:hypothetical protein
MNCALAFRHDLPFIPLCYAYITLTSSPQFTSFTSLHFLASTAQLSLHLIYHFPTPFPKITWFARQSLKHLQAVGSRAAWSYLQRNISWYLSFAFCSWFSYHDRPCSDSMAFVIYRLSRAIPLHSAKVSQFESFPWCANLAALFCTRPKACICPSL